MNLQELCIDVIVTDFDKYLSAFSKTDDPNIKRNFEFLQRIYSYQIASQLHDLGRFRVDYIDFLVNKYLRTLDTGWLKGCPWETVIAKFAEFGSYFQKIYFHEWSSEKLPWLEMLRYLSNLEVLIFPHACNDEILKCISQFCHNIREIDITHSYDVSNEGIKYLCQNENENPVCPKLRKLSIRCSAINEDGMKCVVQNIRSLEETDYHNLHKVLYSLHEKDLSALHKVQPYNFITLDVSDVYCLQDYTNLLKVCLSVCPRLKSLSCSVAKKEHLDLFTSIFELEKLYLVCLSNTEINVTDLIKMQGKKLTSLSVHSGTLSIFSLPISCPCLKHLHLTEVFFQDDDNTSLLFSSLESCTFELMKFNSEIAKSIFFILKRSPKLERIEFRKCDLSSNELKTEILRCCECCPIKNINFSYVAANVEFIRDILLNCHSLKGLNIDNCELSSEDEMELHELAKILSNFPEITFNDALNSMTFSDFEENSLNSSYDFENYFDGYEGDIFDSYEDYEDYEDDYEDEEY